ncbi:MAG TPA: SPFH domain-containing protein [Anaerolineae bacterium]|nr:SPFH domain-containing protein [Anaerolineae bacterium]
MGIGYLLVDFQGVRFRWAGSYLWGMAFFISFVVFLLYLLQFVLPLVWYESLREGVGLIFGPTFPFLSKITRRMLRWPRGVADRGKLPEGLPASFARHGAGILDSHQVLALTKGPKYERPAGPGYVRLDRGEVAAQVVDLRFQTRSAPVKAMTRDGIPVETSVSVSFQVNMEESPFDPARPYPYVPEAIFGVNYLNNYRSEDGILAWGETITWKAASILVGELAQYALDELYRPDQVSFSPRRRIKGRMTQKLRSEFDRQGVNIFGASVGRLSVPEEVVEQLISNWQTEWQRRINEVEAATENAALRRIREAQARAQIEIIVGLTESIQAMQASQDVQLEDVVTIRLLEVMKEAAEDEDVKAMVPSQALATMNDLQIWLQKWDLES